MKDSDRIWELVARKLAGEISAKELQEMEELLKKTPDLHFSIDLLLNDWQGSTEKDSIGNDEYFLRHRERLELHRKIKKPLTRNVYLYLSSVIIIILSVWYGHSTDSEKIVSHVAHNPQISYSVPPGKRMQYTLPDGTNVWLNSGSELKYDFNGINRIVELTGEGYFDVFKNKQQPFLIYTPSLQIKVTGTSLNVKAYLDDPTEETSLISGSVSIKLNASSEHIVLSPNEKLILKKNSPSTKNLNNDGMVISEKKLFEKTNLNLNKNDSSVLETLWIKNKLVFENEDLDGMVIRFKRWYGVDIVIENDQLRTKMFTGNFELENVHQAIEALKITAGFNYSIENDTIRIY